MTHFLVAWTGRDGARDYHPAHFSEDIAHYLARRLQADGIWSDDYTVIPADRIEAWMARAEATVAWISPAGARCTFPWGMPQAAAEATIDELKTTIPGTAFIAIPAEEAAAWKGRS